MEEQCNRLATVHTHSSSDCLEYQDIVGDKNT